MRDPLKPVLEIRLNHNLEDDKFIKGTKAVAVSGYYRKWTTEGADPLSTCMLPYDLKTCTLVVPVGWFYVHLPLNRFLAIGGYSVFFNQRKKEMWE